MDNRTLATLSVVLAISGYFITGIIGHVVGLILAIKAQEQGEIPLANIGKILSIIGIVLDIILIIVIAAFMLFYFNNVGGNI